MAHFDHQAIKCIQQFNTRDEWSTPNEILWKMLPIMRWRRWVRLWGSHCVWASIHTYSSFDVERFPLCAGNIACNTGPWLEVSLHYLRSKDFSSVPVKIMASQSTFWNHLYCLLACLGKGFGLGLGFASLWKVGDFVIFRNFTMRLTQVKLRNKYHYRYLIWLNGLQTLNGRVTGTKKIISLHSFAIDSVNDI